MQRKHLLLISVLICSGTAWNTRTRRQDMRSRHAHAQFDAVLNGMTDDPREKSLRLLENAVENSRAKLVNLQYRENALEEQYDGLEATARSIETMTRDVNKETSDSLSTAQSKSASSEPGVADAGKSHLQRTFEAASEHLVSLALAGLTGVRASIPIFVMTLYSKLSDGSAIDLEAGFEWLYSIPALICLGVFLALELICDCVPVVSEAMDAAMLIVKPAVAVVIALAPEYGDEDTSGTVIAAFGCCILAIIVAVAKSSITRQSADIQNAGAAAPARSFLEDVAVAALSLMSMGFSILAAIVVVALLFLLLSYGCFRGKKKHASQPAKQTSP